MINEDMLKQYLNDFDFHQLLNREVYLWGIGTLGLSVLQLLLECGVRVAGAIDARAQLYQKTLPVPVFTSEVLDEIDAKNSYIIITATKPTSITAISNILNSTGKNFEYSALSNQYSVYIDISGVCNLRCKSCPVGNTPQSVFDTSGRKFMTPELFEKIVIKIKKELKGINTINLYIFGDPMLSPHLPEMLKILRKHHLFSIISTNLSMRADLEAILKEKPSCIKISTSGFTNEVYQTTHNNGDAELVKENMNKLSALIEQYRLHTNVIVGYHLYNNNGGSEYEEMNRLCEKLGFLFQPSQGLYWNNLKRMGMIPFDDEDIRFIQTYYEEPSEILTVKKADYDKKIECGLLSHGLFIDWDGKVELCCNFRKDDAVLPYNYLDTPWETIQKDRYRHYLCKECIAHDLSY